MVSRPCLARGSKLCFLGDLVACRHICLLPPDMLPFGQFGVQVGEVRLSVPVSVPCACMDLHAVPQMLLRCPHVRVCGCLSGVLLLLSFQSSRVHVAGAPHTVWESHVFVCAAASSEGVLCRAPIERLPLLSGMILVMNPFECSNGKLSCSELGFVLSAMPSIGVPPVRRPIDPC